VLIVEDIIDTGLTLNYLLRYLRGKNPRVAADLCAARQARAAPGRDPIDYTGFVIPDEFVVGYGLDLRRVFTGTCRSSASSGARVCTRRRDPPRAGGAAVF
jgi:hypoxanthine phosphoribosyltransferase